MEKSTKKKIHVKLMVFLAIISVLVIVMGYKYVNRFGFHGYYIYKGCDAEVVHVLPEGLTDEAISDAVINVEYGKEKMTSINMTA